MPDPLAELRASVAQLHAARRSDLTALLATERSRDGAVATLADLRDSLAEAVGEMAWVGDDDLVASVAALREAATGRVVGADLAAWMRAHPAETIAALREARIAEVTPTTSGVDVLGWGIGRGWCGASDWRAGDESGTARDAARAEAAMRESLTSAGWVLVEVAR